MSQADSDLIGLRLRLTLRDPDPGREAFKLPGEYFEGTVFDAYVGPHSRTCYYVSVEGVLEFDTQARTIRVVEPTGGVVVQEHPEEGLVRSTRIISVASSRGLPPVDTLAPRLKERGRGEAELVDLIFARPLPSHIDLADSQEDALRPLSEVHHLGVGYADIEVLH